MYNIVNDYLWGFTMNVACFEANCNNCGKVFENPMLSDFMYGQFILRSDDGRILAYVDALQEQAIKEIENIFDSLFQQYGKSTDRISCFQYTFAKCSDTINGHEMKIDVSPICPFCNSKNINYDNRKRVGSKDIVNASFSSFLSWTDNQKSLFIKDIIEKYKSLI